MIRRELVADQRVGAIPLTDVEGRRRSDSPPLGAVYLVGPDFTALAASSARTLPGRILTALACGAETTTVRHNGLENEGEQ